MHFAQNRVVPINFNVQYVYVCLYFWGSNHKYTVYEFVERTIKTHRSSRQSRWTNHFSILVKTMATVRE
jgi:hypothetical protein